MEFIERDEKSTQQAHQQAKVNSITKIGTQIIDFEVQFRQMFVHESHQGLQREMTGDMTVTSKFKIM